MISSILDTIAGDVFGLIVFLRILLSLSMSAKAPIPIHIENAKKLPTYE
jgi:hypothetical protein